MSESILIVGAGPVGLIVALELAHHGVRSVLVDRAPEPTKFPKMDISNGRSMEHFRRLGFAERLRELGVASKHSFDVLWGLPDGSAPVARWKLPSVDEQRALWAARNDGSAPLEPDLRVPQSTFEAMGRDLCRASPLIDFREGFAFESMSHDADGVTLTVAGATDGALATVRSAYLVGCDGAGSRVRKHLDIESDEVPPMPPNFMIHFKSRDRAELHRYGQFWHFMVMGGCLIAQDEEDTWTFHAPLFEGVQSPLPEPEDFLAKRLGRRIKIDEVLLTSVWQPRFVLARQYGRGRVFLAGDAVHQVFPTGGYGMNTGVGDAVDIGWKLAAVVQGWGGPKLLESYEDERRPVGERNRNYAQRHLAVHIRFAQMGMEGASRDELQKHIDANGGENEFDGVEFGYRYNGSPVIVQAPGQEPPWVERDYVPSTWPGARPPSFILEDGSALFDHFGPQFTLVDFSGHGADLVARATQRGIPVKHLQIGELRVRQVWERDLVLIRPDQHVAWRAHAAPDQSTWDAVLDQVCGTPPATVA